MKSKSYMPGIALKNVNERVHICSICSRAIMRRTKMKIDTKRCSGGLQCLLAIELVHFLQQHK